jgi:tetratricopeptide (TPR) repeat protein
VSLWPEQEKAIFTAGTLLFEIDPRASIALLEKRVALFPADAAPWANLGGALFGVRDYDGAERALRHALEREPNDPWTHNLLHAALRGRGCLSEARDALVAAVVVRPQFLEAWGNLALLEAAARNFDAARFAARCALDLDSGNTRLRLILVQLLEMDGNRLEALHEAETALGLDPRNPTVWAWLSDLHAELDRHDLALTAAEAGLELAPDDAKFAARRDDALRALASER